jgi:hypothetical protein
MGRLVLKCGYRLGWCDDDRPGHGSDVLECVGEARLRAYGGGQLEVNYVGRRAYGGQGGKVPDGPGGNLALRRLTGIRVSGQP